MTTVVHCMREDYDVYIGRGKDPKTGEWGKWGNPFRIGYDGGRKEVVEKYRQYILSRPDLIEAAKSELKGKVLGCWCPPGKLCHGKVLAEIADQ